MSFPLHQYNFKVMIQGVGEAHFTQVSEFGFKTKVTKYREAGNQQITQFHAGLPEPIPMTLRYGLSNSKELFQWMMDCAAGRITRRNVSIVMLDATGTQEVTRWNLNNAWPAEWRSAQLDAMGNEIAISSLTLIYDSLSQE